MAASGVFLGRSEVEVNGFGVPDMKVAIGLGGEAGDDGLYFVGSEIVFDDLVNKMS